LGVSRFESAHCAGQYPQNHHSKLVICKTFLKKDLDTEKRVKYSDFDLDLMDFDAKS